MTPVSARVTAWVEEIAKAHAAATRGWNLLGGTHERTVINDAGEHVCDASRFPDAAAIVAAHNAMPALLAVVRGVAELADTYAFLGATLHSVPAAESYTDAANDLRRLLADAAPDTEKETGE